jgi:hypothetical protein
MMSKYEIKEKLKDKYSNPYLLERGIFAIKVRNTISRQFPEFLFYESFSPPFLILNKKDRLA